MYQLSNPGIESVSMTIHISHRGMVEFNKRSMDWRGRRVSEYERCVTALIHFLLLFKSKSPPSPSESKSLVYTSVSFFLSCIQGRLKWIILEDLLYYTWNSVQYYVAAWMGGESGAEWIHVYVWLSPFAVHLKYHNIVNQLYPHTK